MPPRSATSPNPARSRNMSAVRGRDTKPEMEVRRAAHNLGLRYRLCRRDLPGRPDLTFQKWRTVLFVNGCFWHQHGGCPKSALPKTNVAFWATKLRENVARDQRNFQRLERDGWRVVVIWECELARGNSSDLVKQYFPSASCN